MRRFFRKEYWPFFVFGAVMVFYHLLINETYGDAVVYFSKVLDTSSLTDYLSMRYTQWTSRLIIEGVLVYVSRSQLLWKILDCCMWMLLVVSMSSLTPSEHRTRNRWIIVLLWLMYPFWEMSSAGWIATTVNYCWPLALGVFSMTIIARMFRGQPIRWYHGLSSALALLYAANAEQMCVVLFAVFGCALLYQLKTKRASAKATGLLAVLFAIVVAELLFILTCPGNQNRTAVEMQTWYPSFSQLHLGQKLQLGIADTLYVLQSSFAPLYGLLCLLLLVLAWQKRKTNPLAACAACVPFGCACVFVLRGFRQYGAQILTRGFISQANATYELSAFALVQSLMVLVCIVWALYQLYPGKKATAYLLCGLLLLGGATRAVLGFSPTIYVSAGRTFIFLYACMIYVNAGLIEPLTRQGTPCQWSRYAINALVFVLAASSVLLTTAIIL